MKAQSACLVLVLVFIKCTSGVNILVVAPLASPSHYLWNKALSLELVKRGHNITILAHDEEKNKIPNYTAIQLEGLYEQIHDLFDFEAAMHDSTLASLLEMKNYCDFTCAHDLETNGLKTLLSYPRDHFDLIIFDVTYGQCLYPLIDRFNKPPVVAMTAFLLPLFLSESFGNHVYSSYMPYHSTEFGNRMSFSERLRNFVYVYAEIFIRKLLTSKTEHEMSKKVFGDDTRTPAEIEREMSLLLANTDPVLDYPMALPPNIIPVGGIHIRPAGKLPQDLHKIMDEAKHGVILFSLGTNVHFDMLKKEQQQALLRALGRFQQIVLWKIRSDTTEGFPKNIIVRKWLPQNDILGHPNLKLFISHGGALSTQEVMYHGVPVVAIPLILDQYVNAKKFVDRKLARYLDHKTLTEESVYEAVSDVLNNPMYKKNMQEVSRRYRDQPQTALERGIFWIEYILKHGDAHLLNLPARDMSIVQVYNLDVVAVVGIGLIIIYKLLLLTLAKLLFLLRGQPKHKLD